MPSTEAYRSGVTIRSVCATLFAMVAMAVVLVFGETIDGSVRYFGMHILAVPALAAFLALLLAMGGYYAVFRAPLLSRAELLCVLFSLLMAAPIMGMGFWSNFIWLSSTIPSQGDFEKMDAVSDRLWPHGPNLLDGAFQEPKEVEEASSREGRRPRLPFRLSLQVSGSRGRLPSPPVSEQGHVEWRETEYEEGVSARLPVLVNEVPGAVSWVRIRLPLEKDGEAFLTLGERYLASVLARGRDLGADAVLSCRAYFDDGESFGLEAFTESRPAEKISVAHRKGFQRYGVYGIEFARSIQDHVDIEFRLTGQGTVELADPKLICVSAFESLLNGRQAISEAEYRTMRPCERAAYTVAPDSWWSGAGLRALFGGYIPLRAWVQPVAGWLALISLLLLATFSVAVIMRKQWVDNERYPLPITRIPLALLGSEEESTGLPALRRDGMVWLGFGTCLFWCLMRAWHAYNPNVPNMNVAIDLKPYFDAPSWGDMWNGVSFQVSALVLSVAIFMELNVLLSLVIGFFLYRSLYWLGEANGWAIGITGKYGIGAYPYGEEQMIGACLTYAALTLFFVRKHLWRTVKSAFRPSVSDPPAETGRLEGELFSSRSALILLALSFAGALIWAQWTGVRPLGMLVLFGAMALIGFVAMKLRAECGTPFPWFSPGTRLLIPMAGGMAFFGARGTMLSSWMAIGMMLLFILPGLQLEFLELARRARIRPRHVAYTLALGVGGGMLIGGWIYLSSLYGIGATNAGFSYLFDPRPWEFYPYLECQRVADTALTGTAPPNVGFNPANWGYIGASVVTAVATLLRQMYPGFWFHPIAVVVASTAEGNGMLTYWSMNIWGTLLVAWAIRLAVLKLGGASAVRNRLFPFFIGVFGGALLAQLLFFGYNGYLYFFDTMTTRQEIVF